MDQVHIPMCSEPACQPFLQHVRSVLEQNKIRCITHYAPGGLFKDCFRKAFTSSHCTVIHICSELMNRVKRILDVLKEDDSKAWFVRIKPKSTEFNDFDFLLDFNITDAISSEGSELFIKYLLERAKTFASNNNVLERGISQDQTLLCRNVLALNGDFSPWPLVMRTGNNSQVMVNSDLFSAGNTVDMDVINALLAQDDKTCLERAEECLILTSQKLLPALHDRWDISLLAQFVCSKHPTLQFQALQLIGWLLLEEQSVAQLSSKKMWDAEKILYNALETQSRKYSIKSPTDKSPKSVKVSGDVQNQEFLVCVYLMLLSVLLLKGEDPRQFDAVLETILHRPLFKDPSIRIRLTSAPTVGNPDWQKAVKSCLTAWKKSTCGKVQEFVLQQNEASPKALPLDKVLLVLPVLVATLQNSFRESKPLFVTFLEAFQPKKVKAETLMAMHRIILSVAMFGLSSFMHLQSEKLVSSFKNFLPFCEQSIKLLLTAISTLNADSKIVCLFHCSSLLFSANKSLRQYTGCLLRQHQLYYENMVDLLIHESVFLLWPLLKMKNDRSNAQSSHTSWAVLPCECDSHDALMHLHKPTTLQHINHNSMHESSFMPQDQFLRELSFLKSLKHQNILQLFAFHEACCPQFYITEDYNKDGLQGVLVNRSISGHRFLFHQLVSFLLDALEGISYCHKQNMIHRNLTAASLFITHSTKPSVKLSGFKYALRLFGKPSIRDYELSCLATRWSAPESLQNCSFSLASDMWMVGHLIYEVLTHGRLPYSDTKLDDETLMPLVANGQQRLYSECCIPDTITETISSLTAINVDNRKTPEDVISCLNSVMMQEGGTDRFSKYFPDINAKDQMATNHSKGPITSVIDEYPDLDLENTSENSRQQHKNGPKHFNEQCPNSFSATEWTVLCQEDLPSVTKWIGRPRNTKDGHKVLPFAVQGNSLYSLREAVVLKVLGRELEPYLQCLHQLAQSIAYLHSRKIILCDISADSIHVDSISEDHKIKEVWITSLPLIKVLPENWNSNVSTHHIDLNVPTEMNRRSRAAPEVQQRGQYSIASDVFCFGTLVWWVFSELDKWCSQKSTADKMDHHDKFVYEYAMQDRAFGKKTLKPKSCPSHIFDVLQECWQIDTSRRPRMDCVRDKLVLDCSQIIANVKYELFDLICNPSEADSISHCSSGAQSLSDEFSDDSDREEHAYERLSDLPILHLHTGAETGSAEETFNTDISSNVGKLCRDPVPPPLPMGRTKAICASKPSPFSLLPLSSSLPAHSRESAHDDSQSLFALTAPTSAEAQDQQKELNAPIFQTSAMSCNQCKNITNPQCSLTPAKPHEARFIPRQILKGSSNLSDCISQPAQPQTQITLPSLVPTQTQIALPSLVLTRDAFSGQISQPPSLNVHAGAHSELQEQVQDMDSPRLSPCSEKLNRVAEDDSSLLFTETVASSHSQPTINKAKVATVIISPASSDVCLEYQTFQI